MEKLKNIYEKVQTIISKIAGDEIGIYAAQASFFLMISAIPFLLLCFTVIKSFINIDLQTFIHTINSYAPPQVSMFLTTIINELFSKASNAPVISISAVTTLWLASKGVMALFTGLNRIYNAPEKNYFYRRSMSLIYTLIFIAALILTILFFGFGNRIEEILSRKYYIISVIFSLFLELKTVIFVIYLTLIFALFYRFLPKYQNKFSHQLPGALFSAIGWMVFSHIYSIYIENYSNYSYVYGSVAAIVFLMLWLYFCMNIFLYGARFNKFLEKRFFKK